jgi:hypothetical protein
VIKKKKLHKLLNDIFDDYGQEVAVVMADKVKDM